MNRESTILTHYTHWLTSQDDTTLSSMSIPSSVLITPACWKHQHMVRPSIRYNLTSLVTLCWPYIFYINLLPGTPTILSILHLQQQNKFHV